MNEGECRREQGGQQDSRAKLYEGAKARCCFQGTKSTARGGGRHRRRPMEGGWEEEEGKRRGNRVLAKYAEVSDLRFL